MDIFNVKSSSELLGVFYVDIEAQIMYKAHGQNRKSTESIIIPSNFQLIPLSEKQRYFFCRDLESHPNLSGLEFKKWIKHGKQHSLCINDILNLRKGQQ